MAKTTTEKIEGVQEQIRQLENQKKRLMQEQKQQERKARTKRLIERGAMLESRVEGAGTLTNEDLGLFLDKVLLTESARRALADLHARQRDGTGASGPAGTPQAGGGAGQAVS
jgi:hypothetical protein